VALLGTAPAHHADAFSTVPSSAAAPSDVAAQTALAPGLQRTADGLRRVDPGLRKRDNVAMDFLRDVMTRKKETVQYAICVSNDGYPASLELRKVYRIVPDQLAATRHFVRVVDESGEDYLYPEDFFVPIKVPQAAQNAFAQAS